MVNNSQNHEGLDKAKAFFERAEEVAVTGNFDYAIDMFLEGLRQAPDAVEHGHSPLRQMALLAPVERRQKAVDDGQNKTFKSKRASRRNAQ